MPTFNRAHVISRALKSVAAQAFTDFEVIVVDDGSTDGTAQVIDRTSRNLGIQVAVVRGESNRGAAHARNTGVSVARGKYIAFLDADDEWVPEKLATQVKAFAQAPATIGLITTRYRLIDRSGHVRADNPPDPKEGNLTAWMFDFLSGQREIVGVFSTLMFRRELFKTVGGLDESLACWEDADFYCRAAAHSEFAFLPAVLTRKHESADSISASWTREAAGVRRFWQKYRATFGTRTSFRRYVAWHQHCAGIAACVSGDLHEGRRLFRESMGIWPFHVQPAVHLLATVGGARQYGLLWSKRRRSKTAPVEPNSLSVGGTNQVS